MQGGAGNDLLAGNKGLYKLDGGLVDDRINAGRDSNTIIYRPEDSRDRVFDFGGDGKLDLTAFDLDLLIDIFIHARETDRGKAFFNFGDGDVLKLVGFPREFLNDSDFIF